MLIDSISEMQEFNGRLNSGGNDFDDYKSSLRKAELMQIIPIIGTNFYKDLDRKYNTDSTGLSALSDDEKELLPHIQCAMTWFAIAEDLPANLVITGKNGVQEMESQHAMAARKWGYFESKGNAQDNAEVFSEYLLNFLEDNATNYPLWTSSDEYSILSELIINSGTQMNEFVAFSNKRRAYLKIRPNLKRIQRTILEESLSTVFLEELRTQHQTKSLTTPNRKAFNLAAEALAFFGFSDAILSLNIIVASDGLRVSSFTNGIESNTLLGEKERKERKADLLEKGQKAMTDLLCLLRENLDLYPTYRDSGVYTPPVETTTSEFNLAHTNDPDDPVYVFG